jgi:hypothetical protein
MKKKAKAKVKRTNVVKVELRRGPVLLKDYGIVTKRAKKKTARRHR